MDIISIHYIAVFVLLIFIIFLYLKVAKLIDLNDIPNERSSHKKSTVRGGGIIFPIAVLLWTFMFEHNEWYFSYAVLLIGLIGFLDDKYSLSQLPRLVIQSIGVVLLMFEIGLLSVPIFYVFIAFIVITGWLNTFNFMDGINGISVLYASAVIGGVYLFLDRIPEVPISLIYVLLMTLIIFGFLNVRKEAIIFAGDVGSLSLGLILAYFVFSLIIETGRWEFILFLSVYGVDSILTIIHRLIKKENIFKAHRSHLYQYMANELGWGHLIVSFVYSLLQFIIIVGLLVIAEKNWLIYSVLTISLLLLKYIIFKYLILNRLNLR